jgi:hypothetical protein
MTTIEAAVQFVSEKATAEHAAAIFIVYQGIKEFHPASKTRRFLRAVLKGIKEGYAEFKRVE